MSKAKEIITKAKVKLIIDEPFFATLALRMHYVEATVTPTGHQVDTMCTDGKTVYYNPDFTLKLSTEEGIDSVTGVLAHECMHPALMHHTRRNGREPRRWNMACDYALNPLLTQSKSFKLPKDALLNSAFNGKTAEEIYNLLPPLPPQPQAKANGSGNASSNGQSNDPGKCGGVIDSPANSESDRTQDEAEMKQALAQAATVAKQQGRMPAHLEKLIEEILAPKINWREVLARFLTEAMKSDYTFSKPNKRYLHTGLYLPAMESIQAGVFTLMVDTSGSISLNDLKQFCGEMQDILSVAGQGFTVIQCDAEVSHVEEVEEPEDIAAMKLHGGGGTDFRPPFEEVEKLNLSPACAVYFTDGFCNSFPEEPAYPVLWAIHGGYDFKPPFGEVVHIQPD